MKGKNIGVQKRILDVNPLVLYVPCGSHILNSFLCDSAKSFYTKYTLYQIYINIKIMRKLQTDEISIKTDKVSDFLSRSRSFLIMVLLP